MYEGIGSNLFLLFLAGYWNVLNWALSHYFTSDVSILNCCFNCITMELTQYIFLVYLMSWIGAMVAQLVWQLATGWVTEGWSLSPCRVKNFLHVIQTGSGAHLASYSVGTGSSFPGIKRLGHEADHSPTSPEIKILGFTSVYIHSSILLHGIVLN
jgi:hypothetical protein